MNRKILIILIAFFITTSTHSNEVFPFYGSSETEAPVKIKVFSSLTCPHCAKFHNSVLPKLVENYVNEGKVSITLMDYPLDLPSLKAAQVAKCFSQENQKVYLDEVYKTQSAMDSYLHPAYNLCSTKKPYFLHSSSSCTCSKKLQLHNSHHL